MLQKGERRLQSFEFVVPVVVGTAAFYLGKKVTLTLQLLRVTYCLCSIFLSGEEHVGY